MSELKLMYLPEDAWYQGAKKTYTVVEGYIGGELRGKNFFVIEVDKTLSQLWEEYEQPKFKDKLKCFFLGHKWSGFGIGHEDRIDGMVSPAKHTPMKDYQFTTCDRCRKEKITKETIYNRCQ